MTCEPLFVARVDTAADGFLRSDSLGKLLGVGAGSGEDILPDHVKHRLSFDVQHLAVVIELDLIARMQLGLGVDLVAGEELDVLLAEIIGHTVGRGAQVQQAALLGFLDPALIIAVAVEDNALVLMYNVLDKVVQSSFKVVSLFEDICILTQGLGDRGVQNDVHTGNGRGGAGHTELELVAGESKGRSSVAVGGVLGELRQYMDADLDKLFLLAAVGGVGLYGVKDRAELIADEHGDDSGRRFVCAETVVVAGGSDGDAEHILIIINGLNDRAEHQQELSVLIGSVARLEKVHAGVGAHGPVVVLAAAVDAGKGLFVQKADHVVLLRYLLHELHGKLVVVGGDVSRGEDRCKLVLCGSDFVMLGLCEHAELPQLVIELLHKGGHAGLDSSEVMILQLLTLGRLCAEERASGIEQILALIKD